MTVAELINELNDMIVRGTTTPTAEIHIYGEEHDHYEIEIDKGRSTYHAVRIDAIP